MALTITTVTKVAPVGPGLLRGVYSILWDNSYPTGGEPLWLTRIAEDFDYIYGVSVISNDTLADNGYKIDLFRNLLVAALENAKPGDTLLVASYGDGADALALRVTDAVNVPICTGENLSRRQGFKDFILNQALDIAHPDIRNTGGLLETKKIADMADTYLLPTSPHTCGGPLLYMCSAHLCTAVPNFLIMESNYWKCTHQYPYFAGNVPVPKDGHVSPPELPGIGAQIRPELFRNGDAIVETIAKA